MQRRSGAVEPDVTGDSRIARARVKRLGLGDLMDESPARQHIQEIGLVSAHRMVLSFALV